MSQYIIIKILLSCVWQSYTNAGWWASTYSDGKTLVLPKNRLGSWSRYLIGAVIKGRFYSPFRRMSRRVLEHTVTARDECGGTLSPKRQYQIILARLSVREDFITALCRVLGLQRGETTRQHQTWLPSRHCSPGHSGGAACNLSRQPIAHGATQCTVLCLSVRHMAHWVHPANTRTVRAETGAARLLTYLLIYLLTPWSRVLL
jgi:hypothetical protein